MAEIDDTPAAQAPPALTSTRLREVHTGQGMISCMYRHGREQRSVNFDSNDPLFAELPFVVPVVFEDGSFVLEDHEGRPIKTYHAPEGAGNG